MKSVNRTVKCFHQKVPVKKSIFIITSYQRLERTRLGTECARMKFHPFMQRKGLLITSFHGQSLVVGRAWLWVRRACALPSTATITLASPLNCSQLKFPHLQEMEIIMPSCMSQDFSDYKWQKPKSYFRTLKKIIYWKTMGEAQRLQKTAPPTWRTETQSLTTDGTLSL